MPVSDGLLRERLDAVSVRFFEFGRGFAQRHDDTTFVARAAAGIARSMLTSTRFELSPDFARAMLLRGRYILANLQQHHAQGRPWSEFELATSLLRH